MELIDWEINTELSNSNDGVSSFKESCHKMISYTDSVVILDDAEHKRSMQVFRKARKWRAEIEQARKRATEPFRNRINAINQTAREISAPLHEIEEKLETKALEYKEWLQQEADRKLKEAAALWDLEELPISSEISINTKDTVTCTRTTKRFRLKDLKAVPQEFVMINEEAINKAIKNGINEIPGIEIFEETITSIRNR